MIHSDEALGAKSFPLPYLAPTTKPEAFLRGLNYASGASGILDKTGSLFVCKPYICPFLVIRCLMELWNGNSNCL